MSDETLPHYQVAVPEARVPVCLLELRLEFIKGGGGGGLAQDWHGMFPIVAVDVLEENLSSSI